MQDEPVRVEVDDQPGVTAIWPLSSKVEIMEDLPDGGALVRVWGNLVRSGRISAKTLDQRDDWDLNMKLVGTRARRFAKREKIETLRVSDDSTHWIDAEGNPVVFDFMKWAGPLDDETPE